MLAAVVVALAGASVAPNALNASDPNAWACPVCGIPYSGASYASKPKVTFTGGQTLAIGGDGPLHIGGGCVKLFNEDPAKYLASDPLPITPSRAGQNATCPVSGETFVVPADADASYIQFNHGQVIYTCCPHCVDKLKANLTNFIASFPKEVASVEAQ